LAALRLRNRKNKVSFAVTFGQQHCTIQWPPSFTACNSFPQCYARSWPYRHRKRSRCCKVQAGVCHSEDAGGEHGRQARHPDGRHQLTVMQAAVTPCARLFHFHPLARSYRPGACRIGRRWHSLRMKWNFRIGWPSNPP
jgi:hypothetical protein